MKIPSWMWWAAGLGVAGYVFLKYLPEMKWEAEQKAAAKAKSDATK
jgi:hypothetical protein